MARCAFPPVVFPCMRPPVWKPRTGPGWKGCAGMSFARRWAAGRLQILDAEQVAFSLKSVWSNGTYQNVLSPDELLEKRAALVPPPRLNLVRYHGVLTCSTVGQSGSSLRRR